MRRRVTLGIIMTLVFTPLFGWGGTMTANEKGSNAGETVTASGLKYVDQAVGAGDVAVDVDRAHRDRRRRTGEAPCH